MDYHILFNLAAVLLLVLVNGYFVASEYALVSARATRMKELADEGTPRAQSVIAAQHNLGRMISATQVGVTIASLALGWVGEPVIARILKPMFHAVGLTGSPVHIISVALGFFIITFFHVVVGEIVPKAIALQKSERTAMITISPLRLFAWLAAPLTWMLSRAASRILVLLSLPANAGHGHSIHSEEELKMLVSQSSRGGVLEVSEQEMLYNVFDFADKRVVEVMVPRPEIVSFAADLDPEELVREVNTQPYTRYPIYEYEVDNIIGILHTRDLLQAASEHKLQTLDLKTILRPAYVVPESKTLADLLADLRRTKSHMALIMDEYGALEGIATLEDLLEEIVGEIDDEHDTQSEPLVKKIGPGHLRVDGMYPVSELTEHFEINLPEGDYQTVGGLVFSLFGRLALVGDRITHEGVKFEVTKVDGSRIACVEIRFGVNDQKTTEEENKTDTEKK